MSLQNLINAVCNTTLNGQLIDPLDSNTELCHDKYTSNKVGHIDVLQNLYKFIDDGTVTKNSTFNINGAADVRVKNLHNDSYNDPTLTIGLMNLYKFIDDGTVKGCFNISGAADLRVKNLHNDSYCAGNTITPGLILM